ncbi:unnamed protein product [Rhizophagus irregularis]|uniref:Uncharacterized protein n=1 Tax=Rhizophagus irregularis TaxID=588596 RepID=A0A2I1GFN7_9GLOM|nr:hypothetical protein RhiirA4_401191 [Rhizophagus irregularis]CAB4434667.1 unnamed protein product [Rhizophagus irregularis]
MLNLNYLKSYLLDFLFCYNTHKIVKVKNRRIGILYRIFQVVVIAYIIIYEIIEDRLYLRTDPPVSGAIRLTVQEPKIFTNSSYCSENSLPPTKPSSCAEEKLPCVYWGAKEIQYASDATGVGFFTTRANVAKYPPGACNFLSASSPEDACIFNSKTTPGEFLMNKSFIADIENYTVMIEHSVGSVDGNIILSNTHMDGQFLSNDGKTVIKSYTGASRFETDPNANGDIITMKEILDAAGAKLDACSFAPGANKDEYESNRSSGIVIAIVIEYENVLFKNNVFTYKYHPQVIDGAEYKAIESIYNVDGSYTIKERHGIRLVLEQYGKISSFDFITLLVNLTAAFTLFTVATYPIKLLILYNDFKKNSINTT